MNFLPAATERAREALDLTHGPWHLWLDKFSFPDPDYDNRSAKMDSLQLIRKVYHSPNQQTRLTDCCKAHEAFRKSLRTQLGENRYREVTLTNTARLLPHLGRVSALENVGLAFDRTTGLPIIPGSAVKGVISTWACWEDNFNPADRSFRAGADFRRYRRQFDNKLTKRILGENPVDAPAGTIETPDAAGQVVFLGGFPVSPPALDLDLVNPHQYEKGKPKEPIPSPFLAWRMGCNWVFPIFTRAGADDPETLLDTTARWLEDALIQYGLGAKTAAGYGGFDLTPEEKVKRKQAEEVEGRKQAEAEAAAHIAALPPEERGYQSFLATKPDWIACARDILSKAPEERGHILRFFRTSEGQAEIARWPKNDKAKKRLENLRQAGL